jgi:hypothetical protein
MILGRDNHCAFKLPSKAALCIGLFCLHLVGITFLNTRWQSVGVIQENFHYKRTLLIIFIIYVTSEFILINPATGVVCFAKSSLIPKSELQWLILRTVLFSPL